MKFNILIPSSFVPNSRSFYRANEQSFDIHPAPDGFTSILVNNLNLELDEVGRVISVWGYCPTQTWKKARLEIPEAEFGDVRLVFDGELAPGVSLRMRPTRSWPVFVDWDSGLVHIANGEKVDRSIKILPDVILDFGKHDSLCGVWLKPAELPKVRPLHIR